SIHRCRHELSRLEKEEVIVPTISYSSRIAYINANLWFGVKAGGSVGHISGVVNALLRQRYDVEFFSAGSRLMVAPEARYIQLDPPSGYGVPFEGNYYNFNLRVTKSLEKAVRGREWSFIYQRLSIANYAGVKLSRRYRLPLVLEYNGSEVWIASRWGRPLSYP